jgi:SAM-dependent methyltransferase
MTDNNESTYQEQLNESRKIWNAEATSFDNEPDHGLRDPVVRAAWTKLLQESLPTHKTSVLDIGCGTGSLSLVLAELGWKLTGIDLSPDMIAHAQAKATAAGHVIQFQVMDAAFPQLPSHQFDVVLCRHILWALPDIDKVLSRWINLLKPGGRLLMVEGYWFTGAGLHSQEIVDALPDSLSNISVQNLSDQPELWGREIDDERYAITADIPFSYKSSKCCSTHC